MDFCLWHKRLEKDYFQWPKSKEQILTIGAKELSWLMDGLSIRQEKAHKSLKYSGCFLIIKTGENRVVMVYTTHE